MSTRMRYGTRGGTSIFRANAGLGLILSPPPWQRFASPRKKLLYRAEREANMRTKQGIASLKPAPEMPPPSAWVVAETELAKRIIDAVTSITDGITELNAAQKTRLDHEPVMINRATLMKVIEKLDFHVRNCR